MMQNSTDYLKLRPVSKNYFMLIANQTGLAIDASFGGFSINHLMKSENAVRDLVKTQALYLLHATDEKKLNLDSTDYERLLYNFISLYMPYVSNTNFKQRTKYVAFIRQQWKQVVLAYKNSPSFIEWILGGCYSYGTYY